VDKNVSPCFAGVTQGFGAGDAIDFLGRAPADATAPAIAIPASCSDAAFIARTAQFRRTVSAATEAFTKRLSEVFPTKNEKTGRGLHSCTFQLNVSGFYGTGGAVEGGLEGVWGR
jgi:hypothetical protein